MEWSKYDLDLRAQCIKLGKPIPGKPEAYYPVRTYIDEYGIERYQKAFNGIAFSSPRDYSTWGKNAQTDVHLDDYETAEDYWKAVREIAARHLDKLIENSSRYRSERITQSDEDLGGSL